MKLATKIMIVLFGFLFFLIGTYVGSTSKDIDPTGVQVLIFIIVALILFLLGYLLGNRKSEKLPEYTRKENSSNKKGA